MKRPDTGKTNFSQRQSPQLITSGNNCAMIAADFQVQGGMSSSSPIKAKAAIAQRDKLLAKVAQKKGGTNTPPTPPPPFSKGSQLHILFFPFFPGLM